MDIIIILLVGLLAGWIASLIMKGRGLGILGDIVVGIIGALIGRFVFGLLGFDMDGFLAALISATVGAVILLALIGLIRRGTPTAAE